MKKFLTSNDWQWRLARTIVQGVIGVLIANIDVIFGSFAIPTEYKTMLVALVMAILSPIMATISGEEPYAGD